MALGIGERLAALSFQQQSISQLLQRREGLHQLINPGGLGNFGVLIQSRGLTAQEASKPLLGLVVPG
jgi:SAM-dependent MidA family methyltransferase